MRAVVIALVLMTALASPARAEDVAGYPVDGDADAGGADPRVAALDEAFGRAVVAAVTELLDAATRKAHKTVLDKEIHGRARLFVVGFKVDKEETIDGRRQLNVTVRVDRDKVRARLEQLDIGAAADPTGGGIVRTGVILLRVTEGNSVRASYGASGEKDLPGLGALASTLRTAGVTIKRATATGPAARATGDLPLDDDDAEALATEAKAELAVIAGVSVGAPMAIRGVATPASLVTARIRVVSRRKLVGQGVASVASRGGDATAIAAAVERAVIAAAADVMPVTQAIEKPTGFTGDDTPLASPGVVLIKIPAKTPYALVAAELKYLTGAKGISRAALHRVSPGGWVIGVTTAESVQKIASIARKAPTADTGVQVKVVGDVVELSISGGR